MKTIKSRMNECGIYQVANNKFLCVYFQNIFLKCFFAGYKKVVMNRPIFIFSVLTFFSQIYISLKNFFCFVFRNFTSRIAKYFKIRKRNVHKWILTQQDFVKKEVSFRMCLQTEKLSLSGDFHFDFKGNYLSIFFMFEIS